MKDVLELLELGITEPLFDVEGQWKLSVVVDAQRFTIDSHVVEESLLVGEVIVVLLLTVCHEIVRGNVDILFFFFVITLLSFAKRPLVCAVLICACSISLELWLRAIVTES